MAEVNLGANAVKLGDFGDIQAKTLAEKEIFRRIKPKIGSWRSRCYEKNLLAPYKTATFRSVVFPKPASEQSYVLLEGIKPDPTGKLVFVEQTVAVQPRGFYATYTDEELNYGFDPIVPLLTTQIETSANHVLDEVCANAYLGGNNVVQVATGTLTRDLFNKIRISLKKFTNNKNARIKAILTPEDIAELRMTYNKEGANLFTDLPANKDSVIDGCLYRFEGVDIEEDDTPYMYGTGNKRYAFFRILDSEGREPVGFIKANGETGEFIVKGVGDGGAAEDPLNQLGSVGVKFRGVGAQITAEECLVRVELLDPTFDTVNSGYGEDGEITSMGNAVERSGVTETKASPATISIVAPNVVVKEGKTLNLRAYKATGEEVTTSATWASSVETVATVGTNTGVVTGVAAGETLITATVGDDKATFKLNVAK